MFFKKRKILTIDELNAYRIAYGNPIERKELFVSLGVPFLIGSFYVFILFFNCWLAILGGIALMAYTYIVVIPQEEKRIYESNAFTEKNNFVNNMTQILSNNERTVLQALKIVTERSNGEFKSDLQKLQAKIINGGSEEVQESFQFLSDKYKDDVMFSLYLEQLTTVVIEGRNGIETLKDIKTYHNGVKERLNKFMDAKQKKKRDFKFMCKVGLCLIGTIVMSLGFERYINVYTSNIIGWISSGIYIGLLFKFYHEFMKMMGDDSITEVKI